jgi:hypothetical protein
VIGREFVKHLRLRHGRIETIRTRFEFSNQGRLVEHVTVETHERPTFLAAMTSPPPQMDPKR